MSAVAGPSVALSEALTQLDGVAGNVALEALPDLFAGLEKIRRRAEQRMAAPRDSAEADGQLLNAEDVAEILQISVTQVYRMAKRELRSAAVLIGPGTLRFDPVKVRRFINSRRL